MKSLQYWTGSLLCGFFNFKATAFNFNGIQHKQANNVYETKITFQNPIPKLSHRRTTKSIQSSSLIDNDNAFNDDIEDDIDEEDCNIKGLFGSKKRIYLISDRMGNLARTALQSSLAQFDFCDDRYTYDLGNSYSSLENDSEETDEDDKPCNVETRIFTFIQDEETISSIIQSAHENNAMVIFTMARPILRKTILSQCEQLKIPAVDLLGPTLSQLTDFLERSPAQLSPLEIEKDRQGLSDTYFRRIEAVEFTLQADDGQAPWLLKDADIILVGVSRTGKTPLSVILSQTQGLKVANVPLVLECPVPPELISATIDPNRVFCLTIAPTELKRIRRTRLERRNVKTIENEMLMEGAEKRSNYGDRAYVLNDLKNARTLATDQGWTEIDVTGRAVEESASYICELMKERFGKQNLYV